MVTLDVCGVAVDFPFQPYDSQLVYMEKVVQALSSKQNAILESPTGTGKTLCLLCATLGWRRHMEKILAAGNGPAAVFAQRRQRQQLAYEDEDKREDDAPLLPRIIYSSRTHSQLKQVVQELKNTAYRPRVAVLGSREHLCVHDKVSQMRGTRQNLACRSTVKANKCQYKAGFDASVRRSKQSTLPIMDIEELVESMKEKHICPFFKTRSIVADAELVFVPYNYLIDPMARRSIGISLENAVLIFDEAHNVESIASEAASYALTSADITGCVSEVDQFIKALSDHQVVLGPGSSLNVESAQTLKALLLEIDKGLNNFPLSSSGGFTKPGQYIFEFFQQFNVNFDTCPLVLSMIEEIIEVANAGNDAQRAASKLDSLLSFLGTIFRNKEKHVQAAENYRVHIQEVQDKSSSGGRVFNSVRKNKSMRVFNYWCFHPGVSFQEICANNVYNVVLTSGTLSPLETTIKELGIEFPVRLENSHVIDANQVWVGVVGTGVTGKRLNSSYNFRSTDAYMIELGNTIVNFTRLVPKGLLVFFPSYTILEQSIERWQKPGEGESKVSIWDRILQQKAAFVEPRGRLDFKAVVDEYHETIADNPNGAVFFAVCRGKVSEGIDFSNDKGRAVVITGLPFPPTKDPKIVLKKGILDQAQVPPGQLKLTGNQWYIQQAARAVNQAIGRVIRHRHDYGAIILCDERFALPQQQNCLSKWLQPYCHPCRNYGEAHIGLTRFFKANKAAHPVVSQPLKSAGLSKKFISPVIPDPPSIASGTGDVQAQTSLRQILEEDTTGIGDGQSYVNPSLLRKPSTTSKQQAVAPPFASRLNTVPRQETVPRKRTLGSMLAANSAIMETTSSISRPFVAPRSRPTGSIASTAVQETSSSELSRQQSANDDSSTTGPAGAFPSIARRVLPAEQVSELYGYVRQLHANNDIEAALEGIIRLLESPSCQELVDLMPKLLGGTISARFVELARSHGLRVAAPALDGTENGESSRTDGPSVGGINSFFAKLQQTKRRRYHGSSEIPTAAVIKDPQCSVCYEITRKAYASRCGHICCLGCWKKMEKDGFTSCPLCKVPVKLDQLSLIRAAKAESTTAESH